MLVTSLKIYFFRFVGYFFEFYPTLGDCDLDINNYLEHISSMNQHHIFISILSYTPSP